MKIFLYFQVMDSSSSSSDDDSIIHSIVNVIAQDRFTLYKWCGKTPGCRANILSGGCTWYRDYLSSNSIYTASHSRRRFRIPLDIYGQMERKLPLVEPELKQKRDVTGKPGVTTWQKNSSLSSQVSRWIVLLFSRRSTTNGVREHAHDLCFFYQGIEKLLWEAVLEPNSY